MRTLLLNHATLRQLTVVGDVDDLADGNLDVWADLKDGRRFGFTVFTPRNVERLMARRRSFVSPGMLLVRDLTDDAILDAVQEAAALGIEAFGVQQAGDPQAE